MAGVTKNGLTTFLWFDGNGEEAANFYVSTFKNGGRQAAITDELRWGDVGPGPKGSILTMSFDLEGQSFVALNGGPNYHFTPGISFMVSCPTQKEIDYFWDTLSAGGKQIQCGWLTDKYGLSWQITPPQLLAFHKSADRDAANRAMKAMMGMVKLDIAQLQAAFDGK